MSGIIYPTFFFLFLRVGLIPTLYLPCRWRASALDVGSTARVDLTRRSRERRTIDRDQETCLIRVIITAVIDATWRHHARRSGEHGPPIRWSRTWHKNRSYNGHDFTRSNASGALDRDPPGAVSRRFITPPTWPNLERPSRIQRPRYKHNVSFIRRLIWTVDQA